ncbi:MAG: hypothetical protein J6X44_00335 [Thermoguttaceae bacterium]|nr:hypothetical protein [Thermoguttaceae bacterium]
MGQPICLAPSGGNDYNFIVDAQSVSATIVDDDHWNVTLTPDYEVLYDESGHIIPETLIEGSEITNGTFATFTLSRGGDGTFHSSDRSYPINVDISLIGQTDSSDFVLSYSSVLGITWTNTTSSSGIVTITIPANEVSVKFRVHAIDDSMVERYFESLTISISDAKNDSTGFSYIEYPFVFTERMLQVQDVGTLTLETVKFINVEDLKADPGQILPPNYFNWQTSTHWTKDQPGITLPVAYVSTNKIKTDAHFSGSIAQDIREQLKIRYRVIGIGAGGLSPSQTVAVSDDDISISNLECDSSIADFKNAQKIVLSVPQLTLEWQFAVGDETIYRVVQGQSQNPFYALFDHPTSDLYLTSVHTACVAANEETSETAVFDAIWAKFHSLSIRKAELMSGVVFETTLLSYYGKECEATSFYTKLEIENMIKEVELALQNGTIANYPSLARQYANSIDEIQSNICFSTEGLLRETDGTCGAWQDFMIDVLGTQKISASRRGIIVNPNTSGGYFKVYSNIDGQGAGTPKECIWRNHAVVEYGDNIYDPSYGKLYGPTSSNNNSINDALTEFVLHSVESIGVINAKNLNVSPLGYGWVYSVTVDGEDLTASDFLLL